MNVCRCWWPPILGAIKRDIQRGCLESGLATEWMQAETGAREGRMLRGWVRSCSPSSRGQVGS